MAKKKKTSAPPETPTTRWPLGRRALGLFALALLATGAVYLASGLPGKIRRHVAGLPENQVGDAQLEITPEPEWLAIDPAREVLRKLGWGETSWSLSDLGLPQRLGTALEASAWIEKARVVAADRKLIVELVYRRPALFVPWDATTGCYVDGSGTVLPAEQAQSASLRECFVVEGASLERLPAIGSRFEDPRVLDSAMLAGFLRPSKELLDLLVIIPHVTGDGTTRFELRTRRGSKILWGKRADPDPDLSDENKLARLVEYHGHYGSLELPRGPYEFDLSTAHWGQPVRLTEKHKQKLSR